MTSHTGAPRAICLGCGVIAQRRDMIPLRTISGGYTGQGLCCQCLPRLWDASMIRRYLPRQSELN